MRLRISILTASTALLFGVTAAIATEEPGPCLRAGCLPAGTCYLNDCDCYSDGSCTCFYMCPGEQECTYNTGSGERWCAE
jgi:hypothetical protein